MVLVWQRTGRVGRCGGIFLACADLCALDFLDITIAEVEFMGERVGATVIFGKDNSEPILGVTALESVGIEIDPRTQRLKRLPAVRLKASFHCGERTGFMEQAL